MLQEDVCEREARELVVLVGVEDLGVAIFGQGIKVDPDLKVS